MPDETDNISPQGTDDRQFEFIEYLGQGLAIFDHKLKLQHYNRKFLDALKLEREDVAIGLPLADLIRIRSDRGDFEHPFSDSEISQAVEKTKYGDATYLHPVRSGKNDTESHIHCFRQGGILLSFDMDDRSEAINVDLDLIDLIGQELFIFDADTLYFIYVNRHVLNNLKFTMEELKQMTPLDVKPMFNQIQFRKLLQEIRSSQDMYYTFETVHMRADESLYPVEIYLQFNPDTAPQTFTAVVKDITERKKAEETILHQAQVDALTGLPNRTVFFDRLIMAQLRADREEHLVALHFLDLDNFKDVNDSRGHGTGDSLLYEVGERLKSVVRKTDTVARLGGDEFAIIQSGINNIADAEVLAGKVIAALAKPLDIDGNQFFIGVSIGVTIYPFDDQTPENLLRNADIAMYEAKSRGRNGFVFYDLTMSTAIRDRNELEQHLHGALDRNEFFLVYQPKVLNSTGETVGMEALLRWQHPERGVIMPAEFIPIAETTGMIVDIGAWVLRTAAMQAKSWQDLGLLKLSMSVNLSAVQFRDSHLIDLVRTTINAGDRNH